MSDTKVTATPANLPAITEANQDFWNHARQGRLALTHCRDCGHLWFPPSATCPQCLATSLDFKLVSGRARLWSWIVMHRMYFKAFPPPYIVAYVELEEGPLLYSTVVGATSEELRCNMPLVAEFDHTSPERSILKFRIVQD
jgi:uncharacterized protein